MVFIILLIKIGGLYIEVSLVYFDRNVIVDISWFVSNSYCIMFNIFNKLWK